MPLNQSAGNTSLSPGFKCNPKENDFKSLCSENAGVRKKKKKKKERKGGGGGEEGGGNRENFTLFCLRLVLIRYVDFGIATKCIFPW